LFPYQNYALNLNHNDILLNKNYRNYFFFEIDYLLFTPLLLCGEFEGDDDNVELATGGGESEERRRISTAFVCAIH